jgi:biopolymer transport protein ExbD
MNFRSILFAFALGLSLPAAASFEIVSKAHEVPLSGLRLPASTAGTLTFKPCQHCDYKTVRVTDTTQYEANRQSLSLEAFRQQLAAITNRQETTVTVVHHLESDTVKAVRVTF